ncbi:MAG: hypothetical protein CSA96_01140, partial [Bacteroidetes bacterium]
MKRKTLSILILVVIGVILGVIAVNLLSSRPGMGAKESYELKDDEFRYLNPELISYREMRNYDLGLLSASGMAYYDESLWVVGSTSLLRIALDGSPADMSGIPSGSSCVAVDAEGVYVGFRTHVAHYAHDGSLLSVWPDLGEGSVISSLALHRDVVYVADAGKRRVLIYNRKGLLKGQFGGDSNSDQGFVVPDDQFDLLVNGHGELWVVNPGKRRFETYSDDGRMRACWQNTVTGIAGFQGPSNPGEIAVMEDGAFVTSETGLIRIKIHEPDGAFRSVVAAPELFKEEGRAPEVCVGKAGFIYALDFDRDMVRVFAPKTEQPE